MVDLRSDTVTVPTPEMRKAMASAEVGDDVFREDPTVIRLQERAAELLGKEDAIFVPSGTMGNQIAVKLHTSPGQEVITEARGHIYNWEMATMAAFSGCLARPVFANRGLMTWTILESSLSPSVYYRAPTGLITLENTHNMAGGAVLPLENQDEITRSAHLKGLPVHLDGARIFNAAVALGRPVSELARGCDSVMFCLSKGLSAPVGSLLAASRDFIKEAWKVRKMMGGGMRQVGILAAAGLVALESMPQRLHKDHEHARILAEAIAGLDLFRIDLDSVQTNIVIADLIESDSSTIVRQLKDHGVLTVATGPRQVRLVTHKDVTRQGIDKAVQALRDVSKDLRKEG